MRFVASLLVALLFACSFASSSLHAADDVLFSRDVHPILRQHCWSCHSGPKAQGGLRFDGERHILRGGESGLLFEPGKPDESTLMDQIVGAKPAMPPKQAPLAPEKIDLIRRWIAAGGKIDVVPVDPAATVVIPKEYEYAPSITSVAISPDGKLAAAACRSEAVLVPLDGKAKPVRLATTCDLVTHVEFSPDGKLLAAAGGTPAVFGEVRFFDVATGKLVAERRLGNDTLFRGQFAPDGKQIALGGADGAAYIVPVDVKQPERRLELHSDWVVDVAWTPDGSKLVTVGRDKTTKVADVKSGQLLRTIDTLVERVNAVVADDKLAVSAGLTRAVTGYDLDVALQNVELSGAGNGARPVSRVAQYQKPFAAQAGEVLDLALSGDRKLVAAAGRYGDVRVYVLADRKPAGTVNLGAPTAYAVALNQDGTQLVVGGKSGTLNVYSLPDGKLIRSLEPVPVKKSVAANR